MDRMRTNRMVGRFVRGPFVRQPFFGLRVRKAICENGNGAMGCPRKSQNVILGIDETTPMKWHY